jgi:hypothetical protein
LRYKTPLITVIWAQQHPARRSSAPVMARSGRLSSELSSPTRLFLIWPSSVFLVTVSGRGDSLAYGNQPGTYRPHRPDCQHPVSNGDWRGSLIRRRSGERLHPGDACLTHPRYAIISGKISRSSITSLFQLVGVFAVALLLRIPLGSMDIVRLLLLSPILRLAGGAPGICFISFVRDPKVAGMAHGMRNEVYLSNRAGVRASCMAHRFASGSESLSLRQTEGKLS